MSLGHHLDHLIRHHAVGWPLTDQVHAFTVSLVVCPVIATGLLGYRTGRVRPGLLWEANPALPDPPNGRPRAQPWTEKNAI